MDSTGFDRSRPLYRAFLNDDGTRMWWSVVADNTPGRAAEDYEVELLERHILKVDWRVDFLAALQKNRKATIYANTFTPVAVPEGCDAVIRGYLLGPDDNRRARGEIFGDRTRRWFDGHPITTSTILEGPDDDGIIVTRNSRYKLVTQ